MNNNIINELFDAPAKWGWKITNPSGGIAQFKIGKCNYKFGAMKLPSTLGYGHNAYKINFTNESVELDKSHEITGTGNSAAVFSTVLDIVKDFKQKYSPKMVLFSAAEPNRKSLYKRIAKTVFPEFEIYDENVYTIAKMKDKKFVTKDSGKK